MSAFDGPGSTATGRPSGAWHGSPGHGPDPGSAGYGSPTYRGPQQGGGAGGGYAGWYLDPSGQWRWWTGADWGPPAHRPPNTTLAVLSQAGGLFGGWLLPLIIYLVVKDDPYVKHHAREGLNFQLTMVVASFAMVALFFVSIFILPLLIVMIPLLFAVSFGNLGFSVYAMVQAGRGVWYRYPICIRFVAG
jgi:uncharacterized Tic20 family protein